MEATHPISFIWTGDPVCHHAQIYRIKVVLPDDEFYIEVPEKANLLGIKLPFRTKDQSLDTIRIGVDKIRKMYLSVSSYRTSQSISKLTVSSPRVEIKNHKISIAYATHSFRAGKPLQIKFTSDESLITAELVEDNES